jgi:hypothetical protein
MTIQRALSAFVASLVALVSLLFVASPAQAAMPSNAPRHFVSIWEGLGYTGAAYPISDDWTGCRSLPSYINNRARSVANNSASPARNIRFYKDAGCSGTSYLFYAGTYDGQLSTAQGDRTYTSYKFV